jgi:hypothetical protein
MHTQSIISAHPQVRGKINATLIRRIDACYDCAQACTACADACLAEEMVKELTQCIRLNLDCADVCIATGALASRRTGGNETTLKSMLDVCAQACRLCGQECAQHASQHEHCRACADACQHCEQLCREASGTVGATHTARSALS